MGSERLLKNRRFPSLISQRRLQQRYEGHRSPQILISSGHEVLKTPPNLEGPTKMIVEHGTMLGGCLRSSLNIVSVRLIK